MRPADQNTSSTRQRRVGIATETLTTFGRSILLGVLKYANLQRQWIIFQDMWQVTTAGIPWPECDGMIVGGVTHGVYAGIKKHSPHVISCSGRSDPNEMPVVALDDEATGVMAAEHLIERGLKFFGFHGPVWANDYALAGRPALVYQRRARGYHRTLRERGFSCISSDIVGPNHANLWMHAHHPDLVRWLKSLPHPIGILAADDTYARDLAEACREAHLGVPDHVAIIGVNNDELLCDSAWPPLSSVECNFSRMGYLAAKMLDRMMNGETLEPEERLTELPPVRVHQRMSTDILAVDQPEVADAIRYIREHACDPCTVKDVMKGVPISRRTLEKQFLDLLGRTLHDEIARVRVETARRLLLQPDLTIDEIGERCGFSAVQNFNRFFHQVSGITPAVFRRQSLQHSNPADPSRDRH